MNNPWTKKDLLSLYDLSAEEITFILDTAEEFKKVSQRKIKKVPALRGKNRRQPVHRTKHAHTHLL